MKAIRILFTIGLLSLSGIVTAKVTMADVNRDTNALNANVPDQAAIKRQMDYDWEHYNRPPNVPNGKIDWSQMPAGSQCGSYVMSGGRTKVQVNCQGHNPKNSCPSGFTRRDFGYFEAGGGARMFRWCSKN